MEDILKERSLVSDFRTTNLHSQVRSRAEKMTNVSRFSKIAFCLYFIVSASLASERTQIPTRRQEGPRACLNYGHSCWGAHGKRSDNKNTLILKILHSMAQHQRPAEQNSVTYPPISSNSVYDQWTPEWVDMYKRKLESYDEIY